VGGKWVAKWRGGYGDVSGDIGGDGNGGWGQRYWIRRSRDGSFNSNTSCGYATARTWL